MKISFIPNSDTVKNLKMLVKSFDNISQTKIPMVIIPNGDVESKELSAFMKDYVAGLPNRKGNYIVNVVHKDGYSGPLVGVKNSLIDPVYDVVARTLVGYQNHKTDPICGFMVRFIPKEGEELVPSKTVVRLFLVN